jgi:small-conductance mechanosensitive channel
MVNETPETSRKRAERNFADLLQELRVAQTGVQILFAFLLTLPFAAGFAGVDEFERVVYVIALLAAAIAAGMIIAPVAYHRVLFRRGRKEQLVLSAHRLASGGLVLLVVAIVCAVMLVLDVVHGRRLAVIGAIGVGVCFVTLWGVLPWLRRNDDPDDPDHD